MSAVRLLSLVLWFFGCCAAAQAEAVKTEAEARQLTDQIMAKVGAGDALSGANLMRPYIIIPAAEFDAMLEQMRLQQPVMGLRFGKSVGHEFIREDKTGTRLLRLVYLHLFEKHVIRWSFIFYRSTEGWVLNSFRFDDEIRALFP